MGKLKLDSQRRKTTLSNQGKPTDRHGLFALRNATLVGYQCFRPLCLIWLDDRGVDWGSPFRPRAGGSKTDQLPRHAPCARRPSSVFLLAFGEQKMEEGRSQAALGKRLASQSADHRRGVVGAVTRNGFRRIDISQSLSAGCLRFLKSPASDRQ